jgi:predicted HTH transcriptional regulator
MARPRSFRNDQWSRGQRGFVRHLGTEDRIHIDGGELLVFDVPNAAEAVMVEANGFPYRVGDQVVREPQEVINRRKEAYRRVGYEQRIRSEATLDDLDLELAKRFVQATPIGARPVEEVLQRYGLLQPRPAGWGVMNAALLLFAKAPLVRWHPRAGIRFFRVAGTERQHGVRRNVTQIGRIDSPIASAIFIGLARSSRLAFRGFVSIFSGART